MTATLTIRSHVKFTYFVGFIMGVLLGGVKHPIDFRHHVVAIILSAWAFIIVPIFVQLIGEYRLHREHPNAKIL